MPTTLERVQAILDPSVPRLTAPPDVGVLMCRLDRLTEQVARTVRSTPLSDGAAITGLDRMSAALATIDVLDPTAPAALALLERRYQGLSPIGRPPRSVAPRTTSTL